MIICISWPFNEIYDETISNVHLIMKNDVTYMTSLRVYYLSIVLRVDKF